MILQLTPPIPLFSVKHQEECYAYMVFEYGLEEYIYFLVGMEKTGEIWVLPSKDLRMTKSFTAGRPEINKDIYSAYLKHGSSLITPLAKSND